MALPLVVDLLVLEIAQYHLVWANLADIPLDPQKPTANGHRQSIQGAGLARTIPADRQVEFRVKREFSVLKALEVLERQLVYAHNRSLQPNAIKLAVGGSS